jgi:phosphopantothenoylcysteine decarboxylase/phosphopantothenate--cysteine ligase
MVEHVIFCGDDGTADLLLIAPCTANTLGKVAGGIDDTPVTTFATTALGSGIPIILVPAMHHGMFRHPGVMENMERLKGWGITLVEPVIEEGKAKLAGADEIVLSCERLLSGKPLAGKRVLITSGPCREAVDDVRVLTTRSTGTMGRELALEAFRLGADVTVVHNDSFPCIRNLHAETAMEMHDQVLAWIRGSGADIYVSAAAISDYAPVPVHGKIPSGRKKITIQCEPLPKLLNEVVTMPVPVIIAFKLGYDTAAAARTMISGGVSLVVTNRPESVGADSGEYVLISKHGRTAFSGSKEECAARIYQAITDRTG